MVNRWTTSDLPTLSSWITLKDTSINAEPTPRRQVMKKTIKNVGLDVHKNSISISIADDDRDGEVRYYGTIDNLITIELQPASKGVEGQVESAEQHKWACQP
jgi:hypothetical protein